MATDRDAPGLFAGADEDRLRAAGLLAVPVSGSLYWREPGRPTTYTTEEAIRLLERRERSEANGHDPS